MADDSTPASDQPNADAPSQNDAPTQLVTDLQDKYGPAPSSGEPSSTEPTTPADNTGQPQDGTQKPDDSGAKTRMGQENAALRGALHSLGIDPDGEKIRQYNADLITKEELLGTTQSPHQPQENLTAIDKLNKLKVSVNKTIEDGQAPSALDFQKTLDLVTEVFQESAQATERAEMDAVLGQCQIATEAVIGADELHKSSPENIQAIEKQVFVGSTDCYMADQTGRDPRYVNPKSYDFYARQNMKNFADLRNHWINHGRELEKKGVEPPPPAPGVNPISTDVGGGPMSPPKVMIKMGENMAQAARDYKPTPVRVP
ncbi:MAG: hypothetical protein ACYSW7_08115 [Planctomycetota bacterium]|jgi:hypothetical protein